MKYCPKCGSSAVSKDKQRGGWTGDYICNGCGFNNAPSEFLSEKDHKSRKNSGALPGSHTDN